MNSTNDRLCTDSYSSYSSFGNRRFRTEDFEQRVFSIFDDGKWDIGLCFYLTDDDMNQIHVRDVRHYMRRFRRIPDFNRTVCFAGENMMSLPTQYLQYNIQSALNMGLRPELLTDGAWIGDSATVNTVFEMLGSLKMPRRFLRRNMKISLAINGIDSDNAASALKQYVNCDEKIAVRVDVRCVSVDKNQTKNNPHCPDQDADIFIPTTAGGQEVRFCFRPKQTVCLMNAHNALVGSISYTNRRGRYKSVFDIKFEMTIKMISEFKQKISR